SLFPGFPPHRLYVADEVTLRCKDGGTVLNNDVKWYKDGVQLSDNNRNGKLEIAAATVSDSGRYTCESGGERSDEVEIKVLDMVPLASLSFLNRAKTVLGKGGAVLMELYVEEGLNDWWCRYTEGEGEKWLPLLPEKWTNSNRSVVIHANVEHVGGRIFWCMNTKGSPKEERPRSNAVKLTATEKMVMLQISQRPAWSGDTVSLSCDVKGGAQVDQAVFYKDGTEIKNDASKDTVVISNVAKSDQGMYACNATYRFTHISEDAPTHNMLSDQQILTVIDGPPMAHLDCEKLYCECQKCRDSDSYRWHYTPPGETRTVVLEESDYYISSKWAGTYTCSAKFEGIGQSRHSNECILKDPPDAFNAQENTEEQLSEVPQEAEIQLSHLLPDCDPPQAKHLRTEEMVDIQRQLLQEVSALRKVQEELLKVEREKLELEKEKLQLQKKEI
ncbi:obscurin-like, partial [Colossoma macropomum]|uniref:obscurin-like n=1 Tax=Colossoma macropomum TaxID=42526 RepID=UPI0018646AAF